MDGTKSPWDLSQVPNADGAQPIESRSVDSLSESSFRIEYVNRHVPVLIKKACEHWPASKRWRSLTYFKELCVDEDVSINIRPTIQYHRLPNNCERWEEYNKQSKIRMRLHEFFTELESSGSDNYRTFQSRINKDRPPFDVIANDLGTFRFLPREDDARVYSPYHAYWYRRSYTDWHFHDSDDQFMCQIVGTKKVMLLPPCQHAWDAIIPVLREQGHVYAVDVERFPGFYKIQPIMAIVQPGDALYFPIYWWHAVQPVDTSRWGITAIAARKSPIHIQYNLRFPAARFLLGSAAALAWTNRSISAFGRLGHVVPGVCWSEAVYWRKAAAMLWRRTSAGSRCSTDTN